MKWWDAQKRGLIGSGDKHISRYRILLGEILEMAEDGVKYEETEQAQDEEDEHPDVEETSKREAVGGVTDTRIMKGVIPFWLIKGWVIGIGHEGTTCMRSTRRVLAVV